MFFSNMKKDEKILGTLGIMCAAGCLFLAIFNTLESSFYGAELIAYNEYTQGVAVSDSLASETLGSSSSVQTTININTASADELAEFLPGIGPSKAKSIVEYREAVGGFDSVDELINVKGIGEKTLNNIRPYCRVSDQ